MNQLNPQTIIDELTRRLQQATLENVVLTVQLKELQSSQNGDDTTVIGDYNEE